MATTTSTHEHDLSSPFWTVKHIAQAFSITPPTAREYSRRYDFPAARTVAGRDLLWARQEIEAWFLALPTLDWTERFAADSARTRRTGGAR